MSSEARTIAVIPVGALEGAKSRLGSVLDAEERRSLVLRLLDRTLTATAAASGIRAAIVVSPDPIVVARARRRGARAVLQRRPGLNEAIAEARAVIPSAQRMLVLPGDLPGVTAAALDRLSTAADETGRPSVVLVADRHGVGTNALLIDPPDAIQVQFGPDSHAAHAALAAAAGVPFVELDGPLSLDVDTPDDLLLAEQAAPDALGVA